MNKNFGQHYLVEFIGCNPDRLKYVADVESALLAAAERSRATVVKHFFHQYEPAGVTGIILICESHFSVHTWPEDSYAAFDILTCGEMDPEAAVAYLKERLEAGEVKVRVFERGF